MGPGLRTPTPSHKKRANGTESRPNSRSLRTTPARLSGDPPSCPSVRPPFIAPLSDVDIRCALAWLSITHLFFAAKHAPRAWCPFAFRTGVLAAVPSTLARGHACFWTVCCSGGPAGGSIEAFSSRRRLHVCQNQRVMCVAVAFSAPCDFPCITWKVALVVWSCTCSLLWSQGVVAALSSRTSSSAPRWLTRLLPLTTQNSMIASHMPLGWRTSS